MEKVIGFEITYLAVLFLTFPFFKLISPENGEWTILAWNSTTFIIAIIVELLININSKLNENKKR